MARSASDAVSKQSYVVREVFAASVLVACVDANVAGQKRSLFELWHVVACCVSWILG